MKHLNTWNSVSFLALRIISGSCSVRAWEEERFPPCHKVQKGSRAGMWPFHKSQLWLSSLKDERKEANKTSFSLYVPLMCKIMPQLHCKGAKPIHPIGMCGHTENFASNFHHRGSSFSVSLSLPLFFGVLMAVHFKMRAESFVLYSQSKIPDKGKSSINMLIYFEVSQVAPQIKKLCFLSQSATRSQTRSSGLSISPPTYV